MIGVGALHCIIAESSALPSTNLTQNHVTYSNLNVARTGTSLHLRRSSSFVDVGDNLALFEQKSGETDGGGVWTFDAYSATPHDGADVPAFTGGSGSTGACVQTATGTDVSAVISGGDLNVTVGLKHGWGSLVDGNPSTGLIYTVFHGTTASEGDFSLRFSWAAQGYVLRVRGTDVLTANATLYGAGQNWTRDADWWVYAWYSPSDGTCGILTCCNGNYNLKTGATTGGALQSATGLWWGSNAGTTLFADARHTLHQTGVAAHLPDVEGLDIGDSITACYLYRRSRSSWLYTPSERRTRAGWFSQAVPGDWTGGQLAIFNGAAWNSLSSIKVVSIMLGANDLISIELTGTQLITGLQNIVNSVASHLPAAKIVICAMTPFFKRIDDNWAGDPTRIALVKGYYDQVNEAIMGGGATPITGVDARVDSYRALIGEGTNNSYLKLAYDQAPTGGPSGTAEGLHPSDSGESLIAAAIRADAYQPLGVLP